MIMPTAAQAAQEAPPESVASVRIGRFSFGPDALLRCALIATALIYLHTITYGFVYDDPLEIEMNPWIQSWRLWRLYFTGNFWSFGHANVQGNYYRPIVSCWLAANYSLFKLIPGWWHLTSVAAHIAVTMLVYSVAARLLRDRWSAAFAALLFGVNPIHIEVVDWVSSVPEILMTGFFLGALLAYMRWHESQRARWMAVLRPPSRRPS